MVPVVDLSTDSAKKKKNVSTATQVKILLSKPLLIMWTCLHIVVLQQCCYGNEELSRPSEARIENPLL